MSFSQRKSIERPVVDFTDEKSMTEQHHKKPSDVHSIMDKFRKTGIVTHLNKHQGTYGDYPSSVDLHTAMNTVLQAQEMFESVPARIRKRFHNDPGEFVDFMTDPANAEEIVAMGFGENPPIKEKPVVKPEGDTPEAKPE